MRCQSCGKYISYADIESGKAIHRLYTPDSAFTKEEYETVCKVCREEK